MAELTLLPLSREHLPQLAELERLCFAEPWSEGGLSILLTDGNFGAVLLLDGRAVSYGGMTAVLDEGSVTNIATHPEYRHRGFGRQILRALLSEAERRGLTRVFLEVRQSNAAAKSLYESEGFAICGERKNFYRCPTEHAWQMVWCQEQDTGKE